MSGKGNGNGDSLANSSLNTSRVPPQDGQKADPMPSNRTLPGNDQEKGLERTHFANRGTPASSGSGPKRQG